MHVNYNKCSQCDSVPGLQFASYQCYSLIDVFITLLQVFLENKWETLVHNYTCMTVWYGGIEAQPPLAILYWDLRFFSLELIYRWISAALETSSVKNTFTHLHPIFLFHGLFHLHGPENGIWTDDDLTWPLKDPFSTRGVSIAFYRFVHYISYTLYHLLLHLDQPFFNHTLKIHQRYSVVY